MRKNKLFQFQNKLIKYARKYNIKSGEIFITKTGKSMSRSNIWREIKSLCEQAVTLWIKYSC